MKTLATNKKAFFDYTFIQKYEGGLVLNGNEVKAIKKGHMSLKGAYITLHDQELWLINSFVPHYQNHPSTRYDESRSRKVLLKSREISSIIGKKSSSGLTIIPIAIYLKGPWIKIELALAKSKKTVDKRLDLKKKQATRETVRALRTKT